jgi:hypothetical protein
MIWQRLVLAAFLLSVGLNAVGVLREPSWLAIPAVLAGWYAADLLSGLTHLIMDYFPCPQGKGLDRIFFYTGSRGSPEYQSLKRETMARLNAFHRVAYDFKTHHPSPDALGRRTVLQLIGSTIIAAALPLSLLGNAALLMGWLQGPAQSGAMAFWVSLLLGVAFAQFFHSTLHRRDNPWFIRAMRRAGLLMEPAAHQIHHDTLQRDFATNCGWSNPVINRLFAWLDSRGQLDPAGLEPHS